MRTVGLILPQEEPVYICPHCGKAYKSEAALAKHLQEKHSDPPGDSDAAKTDGNSED